MTPLRFCFPTTFYPPYSFGGDAIAVQRLARALVRRGHEVTVIHDVDAFSVVSHAKAVENIPHEDDGVEVIPLRSSAGRISPLLAHQTGRPTVHRATLRRIFDERRFDVVNFHNASLIGGPGIFSLGGHSTRVYTAHEHWLICPTHVLWRHKREVCLERQCIRCQLTYRRPPQLWRFGPGFRKHIEAIDLFIAMSDFSANKHAEFGFPREMSVLPPFSDLPPAADESASPHDRPYFFFAGRLEEIKGLQDVIPHMPALAGIDLLIAGEGSYRPDLERTAGPQVRFLGPVGRGDLSRLYRHAIATIAPSVTYETFGLTLIESFACSTPVIARRLGPLPEIIEASGAGLLFTTPVELVNAMRTIAEDSSLRTRLGHNGIESYRERWSEEAVVSRYLELVTEAPRRAR